MKTVIVLLSKLQHHGQIYWITSEKPLKQELFLELGNDPDTLLLVNPKNEWSEVSAENFSVIHFLPGVTDNPALVFTDLIHLLDSENKMTSLHSGEIHWSQAAPYWNELIQKHSFYSKIELIGGALKSPVDVLIKAHPVQKITLTELTNEELLQLSIDKKWAMSLNEMTCIRDHFQKLNTDPTDVEIEIIAQTWSEHCKHKIFNAEIKYKDSKEEFTVNSIYKTYIKGATKTIAAPWAVSVFSDNAGVVDWDEKNYLAIKVETHNSPSALDPYGGALTGILGVNRDILGTGLGFSPIANTDVFCVGNWDESETLPKRIKHPKEILTGIHRGVQDGGNKSGIPTVNGAICFDENFTGKPLVYCGTVGIAPKFSKGIDNKNKYHKPGDLIVMSGGRVGHDGIHGATMSSIQLDETVPNTMVQIGDPFTQKKLSDFILALRDQGLITGITDNGAGGLSSSLGEMSERTNGALIHLDQVPLKYAGLSAWEIIVSESQERMSLAIDPKNKTKVLELSKKFGVESTVIGEFTDSGYLDIQHQGATVAHLNLDFLHNGLPQMKINAVWKGSQERPTWKKTQTTKTKSQLVQEILKTIIQDKNIVSKKSFIQNYDHEVKAASIVKPLGGLEQISPNDGGAVWLGAHGGHNQKAIAVSCGIQYMFSHIDTDLMTKLSFDEAMRGAIALGANPQKIAMTDNFCWPDPILSQSNPDGEHKLAQLVRSCRALYEIATKYYVPLISGKDSMKNDYIDENVKISVPPTLLMTAIGHIDDISQIKKTAIPDSNLLVYKIGLPFGKKYFGHFLNKYFEYESHPKFEWDLNQSLQHYKNIFQNLHILESIHDVSEGGILVALTEALFLNRLGINIKNISIEELFSEYPTSFIVSIQPQNKNLFEVIFKDHFLFLGTTNEEFELQVQNGQPLEKIDLNEIKELWSFKWK